MDPLTIGAALLPALTDGAKMIFGRFFGDANPKNVDDVIKLRASDVQRIEAMAKLDAAGDVHRWVNDVRAMQRPIAVVLVVGAWIVSITTTVTPEVQVMTANLASCVVFYLFGDRTYLTLRKG